MEPIKPPKTIRVFQLIKQNGLNFTYSGTGTSGMGIGFYSTQHEAEHNRTIEVLKDITTPKPKYHVFELEIPNPAYQE